MRPKSTLTFARRPGVSPRRPGRLRAVALTLALLAGPSAGAADDRGAEFGLAIHKDYFTVVDGGVSPSGAAPGLVEASLALDLQPLFDWDRTRVHLRGLAIHGGDPGATLGAHAAPSNLANGVETARLLEAWVEHRLPDDRLSVLGGLYAVDTEFDVKETAAVFMNGGFGTGADLSQSGVNGPCAYPSSCLGVRLRAETGPRTYAQVALLNAVATDPDASDGGDPDFAPGRDGLFAIAEAGWQRAADEGRFLRAAAGFWQYTVRFESLQPGPAGEPRRRRASPGLYALLEGEILHEPGRPSEALSGFLRLGSADPDVHALQSSLAAGLVRTGLLPGRGEDATALGLAVALNGAPFRHAQRRAGTPVETAEFVVEVTHRMQLLSWLVVQVGAQYFIQPGTSPNLDDVLLVGLRCTVAPAN